MPTGSNIAIQSHGSAPPHAIAREVAAVFYRKVIRLHIPHFLDRAQQHGGARPSVTADELFLSTVGVAWVLGRTGADAAVAQGLNRILADGYRT